MRPFNLIRRDLESTPRPVLDLFRQSAEQAAQFAREEAAAVRKLHTMPPPDYVDDIDERAKGWSYVVETIDLEILRRQL